jgi:type VI secretion system protein
MELVLTIIAAPPQTNLLGQSQTFAAAGASFGRAADNTWVLPDPDRVVSSRHATLAFQNGQYTVIDHSTNGTFINGAAKALGQGNSAVLNNGDVVTIGPFQLQAILRAGAAKPAIDLGASFLDEIKLDRGAAPAPAAAPIAAPAAGGGLDDLDRWLEPAAPAAAAPAWGSNPGGGNALPMVEASAETDPLALLNRNAGTDDWLTPAAGQSQGDQDWWRDSQPDNAPLHQHAMAMPQPKPAAPDTVNIDDLLGLAPAPAAAPTPVAPPPAFTPPAPAPRADITAPKPVAPAPVQPATAMAAPPAPAPVATTTAPGDLAYELAARLGLANLSPEQLAQLPAEVAAVLRETSARLMDILRARSSIKNELRLERTMIGATENNPLKFSARPEDALTYMFEDRGGAFLRGEAAIRDSFDDLADHQVAVLAGMRAAYTAMLAEFNPAQLEQRFGPGGGGVLGNRKARNWEAYQEYYARLSADAESAYSRLFGEVFARAYETQINELKGARRFKQPR